MRDSLAKQRKQVIGNSALNCTVDINIKTYLKLMLTR
jgi:hypothetical protein